MRNLPRKPKQVVIKEGEDGKVAFFLSNHLPYRPWASALLPLGP